MRIHVLMGLVLATSVAARAVAVGAESQAAIVVAADASGRLVAFTAGEQPFHVPPSRFLGIDGYADDSLRFRALDPAEASAELRPLAPGTPVAFELLYTDPGVLVLNDRRAAPLHRGDLFGIGVPPFDAHPVWIIAGDMSRPRTVTLRLRDRVGGYEPSEALSVTLVPGGAAEAYVCPLRCEDDKTYAVPGFCPVCGTRLGLLSTAHYRADVTSVHLPLAGEPSMLHIVLRDPQGAPVRDLEGVQERALHVFVASADLSWLVSEYPAPQPDGSFRVPITFPAGGRYTVFHEFTPARAGRQVVAVDIDVGGPTAKRVRLAPGAVLVANVDGDTIGLDTGGALVALAPSRLTFALAHGGAPVHDVEPFLGALAHLVLIGEDRKHLVPSRLIADAAGPNFTFECRFPAAGTYKAWAQFHRQGRVITASFPLRVQRAVSAVADDE